MLFFRGKLHNIFKRSDFEDKKTGEIKKAKYQLEFMELKNMIDGQGKETVLRKISIPDEMYSLFKEKIGEIVDVPVDSMSNGKTVILYGVSKR